MGAIADGLSGDGYRRTDVVGEGGGSLCGIGHMPEASEANNRRCVDEGGRQQSSGGRGGGGKREGGWRVGRGRRSTGEARGGGRTGRPGEATEGKAQGCGARTRRRQGLAWAAGRSGPQTPGGRAAAGGWCPELPPRRPHGTRRRHGQRVAGP